MTAEALRVCGDAFLFNLSESSVCFFSAENSWSGHAYEWRCDSHTPHEEYKEHAPPPAWNCPHDNQLVSSRTLIIFCIAEGYGASLRAPGF